MLDARFVEYFPMLYQRLEWNVKVLHTAAGYIVELLNYQSRSLLRRPVAYEALKTELLIALDNNVRDLRVP